jgi:hypothetical protein
MPVSLVPNIPNQLIERRIKNIMQSHGKLHHAKAGTEMSAIDRYYINNKLPEFLAKLRQPGRFKLAEIGRIFNGFEKRTGFNFYHERDSIGR